MSAYAEPRQRRILLDVASELDIVAVYNFLGDICDHECFPCFICDPPGG